LRTIEGTHVDWNETLWRYCTLERFEQMVGNRRIYFAAADQFADPFEGAVAVQTDVPPPDPRYGEMEFDECAFFELKRLTKLNCWHRAEYESDAMWKLYAAQGKGIAICSTADRMRRAFQPFRLRPEYGVEELWGSPIRYVDLTQIRMRGVGMLERFFFKHRAFEWEREFRLAISMRMAEEFGASIPELGIEVAVDLDILIDSIVVGPEIRREDSDHVVALARREGFERQLRFSTLLGRPRYI
jgi:hypothetical protein